MDYAETQRKRRVEPPHIRTIHILQRTQRKRDRERDIKYISPNDKQTNSHRKENE